MSSRANSQLLSQCGRGTDLNLLSNSAPISAHWARRCCSALRCLCCSASHVGFHASLISGFSIVLTPLFELDD